MANLKMKLGTTPCPICGTPSVAAAHASVRRRACRRCGIKFRASILAPLTALVWKPKPKASSVDSAGSGAAPYFQDPTPIVPRRTYRPIIESADHHDRSSSGSKFEFEISCVSRWFTVQFQVDPHGELNSAASRFARGAKSAGQHLLDLIVLPALIAFRDSFSTFASYAAQRAQADHGVYVMFKRHPQPARHPQSQVAVPKRMQTSELKGPDLRY